MNKVFLLGRLTKNPTVNTTSTGASACTVCLAVDKPDYKSKTDDPDYYDVSAYGAQADFISRNYHKGDQMLVAGHLAKNAYIDNKGVRHSNVIVKAENVYWTDKRDTNTAVAPEVPSESDDNPPANGIAGIQTADTAADEADSQNTESDNDEWDDNYYELEDDEEDFPAGEVDEDSVSETEDINDPDYTDDEDGGTEYNEEDLPF